MWTDRYWQIAGLVALAGALVAAEASGLVSGLLMGLAVVAAAVIAVGIVVLIPLIGWSLFVHLTCGPKSRAILKFAYAMAGWDRKKGQDKAGAKLIEAWGLKPRIRDADDAEALRAMLAQAMRLECKVPFVLEQRVMPELWGHVLARAAGGTADDQWYYSRRAVAYAPQDRPLPLWRRARVALRKRLSPLVLSAEDRKYLTAIEDLARMAVKQAARTKEPLQMTPQMQVHQELYGMYEWAGVAMGRGLGEIRPEVDWLPLTMQRRAKLIANVVAGRAVPDRFRLTDPSAMKTLQRVARTATRAQAAAEAAKAKEAAERAEKQRQYEARRQEARRDIGDAELEELLLAHERKAIFLRQGASGARSHLGGRPPLPAGVDWPRHPGHGMPLHYLCGIDCAEMPRVPCEAALPEDGMLLFFADIDEEMLQLIDFEGEGETPWRVLHVPAGAPPRDFPDDMPDVDHGYGQIDSARGNLGRKGWPRTPVEPRIVSTWPFEGQPIFSNPRYREAVRIAETAHFADHMLPQSDGDTLVREVKDARHLMLGSAQHFTNITGFDKPGHVRLLCLDSDRGLDMWFCDAGVTEFWITEADLAARRFDKAWALTAGS